MGKESEKAYVQIGITEALCLKQTWSKHLKQTQHCKLTILIFFFFFFFLKQLISKKSSLAMVLRPGYESESPIGLVKTQAASLPDGLPVCFWLSGAGWGLRMCVSHWFPDEAEAAGPGCTLRTTPEWIISLALSCTFQMTLGKLFHLSEF